MEISGLEEMVLDAIANDFEDLSQIVRDVTGFGLEEGIAIDQADVMPALRGLVRRGFAEGYRFADDERPQPVLMADWGDMEGLYFSITGSGKAYLAGQADSGESGREK